MSGFIIHHVYRSTFSDGLAKGSYAEFLRYRFARIWPVHMVTMAAMLVLYAIAVLVFHRDPANQEAFSIEALVTSVFMVHAWFGNPTPNIPAWSISAEWFAYILFPVVCTRFLKLPEWAKLAVGVVALVAVALWANSHPLLRIAPEFLLGMVLRDIFPPRPRPAFGGLAAVGGLLASVYLVPTEALALKVALFGALIVALASPTDWIGKVCASGPLVYLGEISYSTYMTHGVVWAVVKNVVRLSPGVSIDSAWVVWPSVVLVLGVSALTYHMVELPARRALRRASWRMPIGIGSGKTEAG